MSDKTDKVASSARRLYFRDSEEGKKKICLKSVPFFVEEFYRARKPALQQRLPSTRTRSVVRTFLLRICVSNVIPLDAEWRETQGRKLLADRSKEIERSLQGLPRLIQALLLIVHVSSCGMYGHEERRLHDYIQAKVDDES
ncbi:hypothetical protein EVAR_82341_1 [Eumeta japonica]|uniref:Uncharacterized protein n=1 Tax=Eumeta variegata TaxID=151549 RepID=A0A4C1UAS7_EUMVA|nr:hypothetical protein EVAR_82341_1 [Eumeta japonica]